VGSNYEGHGHVAVITYNGNASDTTLQHCKAPCAVVLITAGSLRCESAAATYVRCPEGKPSWLQTACLIKAGTLLNIWLYFAVTGRGDCECRSGKLCVLDLRLDQKIDGASGCLHSCMHCARLRGDTMEACVHHAVLLGCTI
jgi:hypothetical protein